MLVQHLIAAVAALSAAGLVYGMVLTWTGVLKPPRFGDTAALQEQIDQLKRQVATLKAQPLPWVPVPVVISPKGTITELPIPLEPAIKKNGKHQ